MSFPFQLIVWIFHSPLERHVDWQYSIRGHPFQSKYYEHKTRNRKMMEEKGGMISFGKLSPVNVECHDQIISLRDLGITDEQLQLLERVVKGSSTEYTDEEKEILLTLDNYLDIPAVSAIVNRTYTRLRQMVIHHYTDIPHCFFTDPDVFNDILAHDDVTLLSYLSSYRTYTTYTVNYAINAKQVTSSNDSNTSSNDSNTSSNDSNTSSNDSNTSSNDSNTSSNDSNTSSNDSNTSSNDSNTSSYGAIKCIKWLVNEYKVPVSDRYSHNLHDACGYGNMEVVSFVYDHDEKQAWFSGCMCHAAMSGHLECVKFLHNKGCSIHNAVGSNHIPIIDYICSQINLENDIGKSQIQSLFIYHCSQTSVGLKIVEYLYERYRYWPERCLEQAVILNRVETYTYMIEHSCPMNADIMLAAITSNSLDTVLYFIKQKCPMDQRSTHMAAHLGRLDMVMLLHENKCPWSPKVHSCAAKFKHFDIIKYAYENGCAWSALTCANAAAGGYMDILLFAHEHGGQWNHRTTQSAARFGHVEALRYAYEHGCPWNEKAVYKAAKFGHVACVKYLLEHHCPFTMEKALHAASYPNTHLKTKEEMLVKSELIIQLFHDYAK
jgi:hypothetical protein